MIWSNTHAIGRSLIGQETTFRRTPKYADGLPNVEYKITGQHLFGEYFLLIYALVTAFIAWQHHSGMLIYILLYVASFATIILRQKWEQATHTRQISSIQKSTSLHNSPS